MMKKHGWVERILFGKRSKKDFTDADLPKTRAQQFAFLFRTRFGMIFRLNLLAAIFWLPYIAWYFMASAYISNVTSEMFSAEYASSLFYFAVMQDGVLAVLSAVGFIGLSGIFFAVTRLVRGQSVKIIADFFQGIKENIWRFVILGFVAGLVNFLTRYMIEISLLATENTPVFSCGLAIGAAAAFQTLWTIVTMFACCHTCAYKSSFAGMLKNSVILTFKKLWSALLIAILSVSPVLVFDFISVVWVKIVGACLAVTISIGYLAVLQTVYCHGAFDTIINSKYHPEYARLGLYEGKILEEGVEPDKGENTAEEESFSNKLNFHATNGDEK